MQIQHDKHQYFFEKFLRNEMKPEEANLFKERLDKDISFKEDFEFYFRNRESIIQEELAEYDEPELLIKKPERWGWLYAVLSVLCIVLIVDYFLNVRYAAQLSSEKPRTPLIERINIFKSKKPTIANPSSATQAPIKELEKQIGDTLSGLGSASAARGEGNYRGLLKDDQDAIPGDFFVSDSLFGVIEKEDIDVKLGKLRIQTDSLFSDSVLEVLAIKEILKAEPALKRQLLIEYWDSELHFRGYIFDGKKLLLYDMDKLPGLVLTYDGRNKVYHLYVNFREYHLFNDGNLHKLGE